jgi:hypothetical protein
MMSPDGERFGAAIRDIAKQGRFGEYGKLLQDLAEYSDAKSGMDRQASFGAHSPFRKGVAK